MASPPTPAQAAQAEEAMRKLSEEAEVRRLELEDAQKRPAALRVETGGTSDGNLPLATFPIAPAQRSRPTVTYPQLTRTNYTIWAMKMRVALQSAHAWEATQRTDVEVDMDREALFAIYSAIPDSMMTSLAGRDSAKAAWDAIRTSHIGHDRVREASLQALLKDFEELAMGDAESVDDFAGRITALVAGIRALGDQLPELRVVQKFLQAAPARFMQIVTAIEQCVQLGTLTVEDLVGRYKAHEERVRLKFGDPKSGDHLMLSRSQW